MLIVIVIMVIVLIVIVIVIMVIVIVHTFSLVMSCTEAPFSIRNRQISLNPNFAAKWSGENH